MFKNRSMQVKFVKDADTADQTEVKVVDPKEIAEIATEFTLKTIGAIGAVVAANKILNAACEIAVVAAKAKLK